jgi:hypothetical protein
MLSGQLVREKLSPNKTQLIINWLLAGTLLKIETRKQKNEVVNAN